MIDKVKNILEKKYTCSDSRNSFMESQSQISIIDFGRVKVQCSDSNYSSANYFFLMTHPDIFNEVLKILSQNFINLEIFPEEYNSICAPATARCFYNYT